MNIYLNVSIMTIVKKFAEEQTMSEILLKTFTPHHTVLQAPIEIHYTELQTQSSDWNYTFKDLFSTIT